MTDTNQETLAVNSETLAVNSETLAVNSETLVVNSETLVVNSETINTYLNQILDQPINTQSQIHLCTTTQFGPTINFSLAYFTQAQFKDPIYSLGFSMLTWVHAT